MLHTGVSELWSQLTQVAGGADPAGRTGTNSADVVAAAAI